MRFGNNRTEVSMFMGTFFICNAEKKPTKRGPFFLCGSSYHGDKQNKQNIFVQKEEPADADH